MQILQVPDCPGAAVLGRRLAGLVQGVTVERTVVSTVADAVATGMTGSPTLLVDGTDPFGEPGASPGLYCRLYADPETGPESDTGSSTESDTGSSTGTSPSVAALRDVLDQPRA